MLKLSKPVLSRERMLIVLLTFFFLTSVAVNYATFVVPSYYRLGYVLIKPPSFILGLFLILLSLLPAFHLPIQIERPSQFAYWYLYLTVFIPSVLIPYFGMESHLKHLLLQITVFTLSFYLIGVSYRFPLKRIPAFTYSSRLFFVIIFLVSVLFYRQLFNIFGLHLEPTNFKFIYSLRENFDKIMLQPENRFLGYWIAWQGSIIHPLFIARGLDYKNWFLLLIGIFGQWVIYSHTGLKTPLLSVLLLFVLWLIFLNKKKISPLFILSAGIFLALIAAPIDRVIDSPWISSLFIRRTLVTPGLLTGYYFDFFSTHSHTYFSDSFLRHWIPYPYDLPVPKLIGLNYFHHVETSANANFFASSYAELGLIGMPLVGFLLSVYFFIYDSLSQRFSQCFSILMILLGTVALSNSSLQTCLLTHGLFFLLILLALMPVKREHLAPKF